MFDVTHFVAEVLGFLRARPVFDGRLSFAIIRYWLLSSIAMPVTINTVSFTSKKVL